MVFLWLYHYNPSLPEGTHFKVLGNGQRIRYSRGLGEAVGDAGIIILATWSINMLPHLYYFYIYTQYIYLYYYIITLLYCIILYYIILYHTILYQFISILLYYTILYYINIIYIIICLEQAHLSWQHPTRRIGFFSRCGCQGGSWRSVRESRGISWVGLRDVLTTDEGSSHGDETWFLMVDNGWYCGNHGSSDHNF